MTPLRQRFTEDMQLRGLAPTTQRSYIHYVAEFAKFYNTGPEHLDLEAVRQYELYLLHAKKLSPESINTFISAVQFLYLVTLAPRAVFPGGAGGGNKHFPKAFPFGSAMVFRLLPAAKLMKPLSVTSFTQPPTPRKQDPQARTGVESPANACYRRVKGRGAVTRQMCRINGIARQGPLGMPVTYCYQISYEKLVSSVSLAILFSAQKISPGAHSTFQDQPAPPHDCLADPPPRRHRLLETVRSMAFNILLIQMLREIGFVRSICILRKSIFANAVPSDTWSTGNAATWQWERAFHPTSSAKPVPVTYTPLVAGSLGGVSPPGTELNRFLGMLTPYPERTSRRSRSVALDVHSPARMAKGSVYITIERCKGCGFCVEFCPTRVLSLSSAFNSKGYHPPHVVAAEKCSGCDLCGLYCPDFAIYGARHAS